MDYTELAERLTPKVMDAIAILNNPEIAPDVRQRNQEVLLREVGKSVYNKIYEMNAFDMDIAHTTGSGIDDRFYGMAKVASNSVSNGKGGLHEYIRNYLQNTTAKAQKDAMGNARESGKRPTVTRTESPTACAWCRSKAGTFTDPDGSIFARHGGCRGKIVTSGYNSRNGTLKNYKGGKIDDAGPTAPIAPDGGQVVFRGTGNNVSSAGLELGGGFYVARDNATAANFGNVSQLSLPLKSKDILRIATDNQYEKLVLDAQRWAVRGGGSLDANDYIPGYARSLGYKAAEVAPSVDPLGGIAIYDPATIKKLQAQMK